MNLAYINDVESFLDGAFCIEAQTGIDLCRNLAWDDLENFLAKLNQQPIESSVNLFGLVATVLPAVL